MTAEDNSLLLPKESGWRKRERISFDEYPGFDGKQRKVCIEEIPKVG